MFPFALPLFMPANHGSDPVDPALAAQGTGHEADQRQTRHKQPTAAEPPQNPHSTQDDYGKEEAEETPSAAVDQALHTPVEPGAIARWSAAAARDPNPLLAGADQTLPDPL